MQDTEEKSASVMQLRKVQTDGDGKKMKGFLWTPVSFNWELPYWYSIWHLTPAQAYQEEPTLLSFAKYWDMMC